MNKEENMKNEEYLKKDIASLTQSEKDAIFKDVKKIKSIDVFKKQDIAKAEIKLSKGKEYPEIAKEISASIRDYINKNISLADAKAGLLIGIITGFLTLTYLYGPKMFEKPIKNWSFPEIASFIGCVVLISSISFSLLVVWPRTLTSKKRGFISWVNVANYNKVTEYLKELSSADEGQIIESLYELNYDLSVVCRRKYYWLRWAFILGFVGIIICTFVLITYR